LLTTKFQYSELGGGPGSTWNTIWSDDRNPNPKLKSIGSLTGQRRASREQQHKVHP
jgi:hypothetical protein